MKMDGLPILALIYFSLNWLLMLPFLFEKPRLTLLPLLKRLRFL